MAYTQILFNNASQRAAFVRRFVLARTTGMAAQRGVPKSCSV
jgi:SpoU rRNA methylase family enzyme